MDFPLVTQVSKDGSSFIRGKLFSMKYESEALHERILASPLALLLQELADQEKERSWKERS